MFTIHAPVYSRFEPLRRSAASVPVGVVFSGTIHEFSAQIDGYFLKILGHIVQLNTRCYTLFGAGAGSTVTISNYQECDAKLEIWNK